MKYFFLLINILANFGYSCIEVPNCDKWNDYRCEWKIINDHNGTIVLGVVDSVVSFYMDTSMTMREMQYGISESIKSNIVMGDPDINRTKNYMHKLIYMSSIESNRKGIPAKLVILTGTISTHCWAPKIPNVIVGNMYYIHILSNTTDLKSFPLKLERYLDPNYNSRVYRFVELISDLSKSVKLFDFLNDNEISCKMMKDKNCVSKQITDLDSLE